MSTPRTVRVAIIGSGPAGWTAAIYAARASLNPVVIAGIQPGGQLTITTDVENYPGFAETIQGPWLMEQMQAQALHVGTEVIHDIVTSADLSQRPFRLKLDGGDEILAETVIISTGAQAKWLGLESEAAYQGFGVSACATCDGFFYRGKKVAVIGGGNTAVEEALYLTNHSHDVTLIHRRDSLRAEKILQERLFKHQSINVLWNKEVARFVEGDGAAGLVAIELRDTQTGALSLLDVDGGFVAIGHSPATAIFQGTGLDLDEEGYINARPGTSLTNIPGVFAAGDVMDKVYRQAITAAGTGCMAALDAERFLQAADYPVPEDEAAGHPVDPMIEHAG